MQTIQKIQFLFSSTLYNGGQYAASQLYIVIYGSNIEWGAVGLELIVRDLSNKIIEKTRIDYSPLLNPWVESSAVKKLDSFLCEYTYSLHFIL